MKSLSGCKNLKACNKFLKNNAQNEPQESPRPVIQFFREWSH